MPNSPFKKLAIFISGRGSNMEAILSAWEKEIIPVDPVLILSSNPDAAGIKIAQQYGIPVIISERKKGPIHRAEYGDNLIEIIKPYAPDIIALAGFMEILSSNFINSFKGTILNIHPSLLPSFPGLHPHLQAITSGVKISGCTVHLVTPKVDSGNIIAQAAVPVLPNDTEDDLSERILMQEHLLYPAVIAGIASGYIDIIGENVTINYPPSTLVNCPNTRISLSTWDISMMRPLSVPK